MVMQLCGFDSLGSGGLDVLEPWGLGEKHGKGGVPSVGLRIRRLVDGGLVGVTFIPAWETAEWVLERMEGDGVMFRGSILNPEFSGSEQFSIFLK